MFERLFGDGDTTDPAVRATRARQNRSLLDFVLGDAQRLGASLGAGDRRKLSDYLDSVREVERRIQNTEQRDGAELPTLDRPDGVPPTFEEHVELMSDLVAIAFQADLTRVVTLTLDAIANGGLWDAVEGGFFRYCAGRDWSEPQVEKVLTVNAQLLELYLLASRLFTRSDYAEQARAIILFVHRTFADSEGGFFASQYADPGRAALSSREARRQITAPSVDHTIYTDATALMASAYILGASVLEDSSLLEFAAEAVDRVVMAGYRRGGGVGHNVTGSPAPRGLLTDHVTMSAALLDLYEATGQAVYLDLPQELMAYCHQTMWDEEGGFADRARNLTGHDASIGLLREPRYLLGLNCRAAIVLARLGEYADEPAYRELAGQTLALQSLVYREHGLAGAVYLLALHQTKAATGAVTDN